MSKLLDFIAEPHSAADSGFSDDQVTTHCVILFSYQLDVVADVLWLESELTYKIILSVCILFHWPGIKF